MNRSTQVNLRLEYFFTASLLYLSLLLLSIASYADVVPNPVVEETASFPYIKNQVTVYEAGAWVGPIRIPPNASSETVNAANLLRDYLEHIGGSIAVETGTLGNGFKIGTYEEWIPYLPYANNHLIGNEYETTILTRGRSLRIHGRDTDLVEVAVWRFLEVLGYRQFFPPPNWEVIPTAENQIRANIGIAESRLLQSETLFASGPQLYEHNGVIEAGAMLEEWRRKNRILLKKEIWRGSNQGNTSRATN